MICKSWESEQEPGSCVCSCAEIHQEALQTTDIFSITTQHTHSQCFQTTACFHQSGALFSKWTSSVCTNSLHGQKLKPFDWSVTRQNCTAECSGFVACSLFALGKVSEMPFSARRLVLWFLSRVHWNITASNPLPLLFVLSIPVPGLWDISAVPERALAQGIMGYRVQCPVCSNALSNNPY